MDFDEPSPQGSGKFTTTSGITYERVYVRDIDMASARHARVQVAIKERFGFDLRSFQVGAIADILDRDKDVFVIAGTSAGKSMVYQGLSIMEKEFITLVITPTIALMTDQVEKMRRNGIAAVALTADTVRNQPSLWCDVEAGKFPVVLASPEILLRDGSYFWMNILRNKRCRFCRRLGALVIDECHLIWGWREFRKDYLGLGTLRAHFPRLPFVALTATATPKVFGFVVKTACLRSSLRLYKLSIDRPNITQLIAQIDPRRGYAHFEQLATTRGGPWRIPKSMIFVDSIDECTQITEYLRALLSELKEAKRLIVRPFHASLEPSLRTEYLESFMNGDTRILVCTDAAGMGVDIGDVEIVMQWKIAPHMTLATLWQRIGRAGRDMNVPAISVVWIEARHILPAAIPTESVWVGFNSAVDADSIQSSTEFVRNMYKETESTHDGHSIGTSVGAYHRIDPSILWYINTKGCRARCMLAAFCDRGAYIHAPREGPCCDNCFYSQDTYTTPDSAKTTMAAWRKSSIRFHDTEEYYAQRTTEQLEADRRDKDRITIRTSPQQDVAINRALNEWALRQFGSLHRIYFPIPVRRRIAAVGARCTSVESLSSETNSPAFILEKSALSSHTDAIVLSITHALNSIINDAEDFPANPSYDGESLNDVANSAIDSSAPRATQNSQRISPTSESSEPSQAGQLTGTNTNTQADTVIINHHRDTPTVSDIPQSHEIAIPEAIVSAIPGFNPTISLTEYQTMRKELLNNPNYRFTNSIRSPLSEIPVQGFSRHSNAVQNGIRRKRQTKCEEEVARSKIVRRAEHTELERQKHALKKGLSQGLG